MSAPDLDPARLGALAAILFLAMISQAVTGFGASVVLVTLGAHVLSLRQLLPIVLPLTLAQVAWTSVRDRDAVDGPLLRSRVGPCMIPGFAVGLALTSVVSADELRPALGALVLVLSLREVLRSKDAPATPLGQVRSTLFLIAAGVTQGLWTTGGPLVVYVLGRESLDKRALRATLAVVWLVLNGVLVAAWAWQGRLDAPTLRAMALLMPVLPLGMWLGELLHRRIDEARFRRAVFALLAAAAIGLIVTERKPPPTSAQERPGPGNEER